MKIEKHILSELLRCYSTRAFPVNEQLSLFYASEEQGYPCYEFSGENFSERTIVWQEGGGCMSILPVPDTQDEFLAVLDFYLKVSPSKSKLIWGKKINGKWKIKDMLFLPFLHRFDIFKIDKKLYFLGATIADDKKNKEDWSLPGSVYTGIFPEDFNDGLEVEKLSTGYFKNHGYTRNQENGKDVAYLSSDQGVVRIIPPYDGTWEIEHILSNKVSEIALGDFDGDGLDEMITIEPFHGNIINIYKKKDNLYQLLYTYDDPFDFGHSLVFCSLNGVPTFLAGVRRMKAELIAFQWNNGKVIKTLIDQGGGPANVAVYNLKDCDLILSANHTENQAVVYVVKA